MSEREWKISENNGKQRKCIKIRNEVRKIKENGFKLPEKSSDRYFYVNMIRNFMHVK